MGLQFKNTDWLGDKNITDGFHWRGGSEADTQGILLWDQPFFMEDNQGHEVTSTIIILASDHTAESLSRPELLYFIPPVGVRRI